MSKPTSGQFVKITKSEIQAQQVADVKSRFLEDNIFIIKKTMFFGLQHKRTPS